MTNDETASSQRTFDLEERTGKFGEAVIRFARRVPVGPVSESLIRQLVKSSTSIGANYCEADDAGTRKEFRYRISICKRESRETKHWLRTTAARRAIRVSCFFRHWAFDIRHSLFQPS